MKKPGISIIIPVFNAEEIVTPFLETLLKQTSAQTGCEVIVVDNGSTDRTLQKVQSFPEVKLLQRTDIQNPYAARNKGLTQASGDLLVLLDVSCTPRPGWLANGIERLQDREVDLVGGQISFTFSEEETLGEWYDSLLFVDMEDLIKRGNSCAGGNLFFTHEVLEEIGPFPENQRSGMDLYWTKKATTAGFNLVYEAKAEVSYPARKLGPLMKKIFRVGTGQPKVWLENDMYLLKLIALIFHRFLPPQTKELKDKIRRRGKPEMRERLASLWVIHYLQRMVLSMGWTKGLFNYYFSKK